MQQPPHQRGVSDRLLDSGPNPEENHVYVRECPCSVICLHGRCGRALSFVKMNGNGEQPIPDGDKIKFADE